MSVAVSGYPSTSTVSPAEAHGPTVETRIPLTCTREPPAWGTRAATDVMALHSLLVGRRDPNASAANASDRRRPTRAVQTRRRNPPDPKTRTPATETPSPLRGCSLLGPRRGAVWGRTPAWRRGSSWSAGSLGVVSLGAG